MEEKKEAQRESWSRSGESGKRKRASDVDVLREGTGYVDLLEVARERERERVGEKWKGGESGALWEARY